MCNHNHDIQKLNTMVDQVADILRKKGRKKLEKRWAVKRRFEAQIKELVKHSVGDNKVEFVSTIQREPNTTIKLRVSIDECETVYGIGFSRCLGKDDWSAQEGYLVAYKKAVRHAARQLSGLE